MTPNALFFGAIGTLVETSDLQRRAFNRAFADAGLDWYWDRKIYARLLRNSGGYQRITDFAAALGENVDAGAIHASKVRQFALLMKKGLTLRPGVAELIAAAQDNGMKLGFVTSTGADQSQAIFDALGDQLSRDTFDYIGDASRVKASKPAPDIYLDALASLNLTADDAIAIEDSPTSAEAAMTAGIRTYAFAGDMHAGRPFPNGVEMLETLDPQIVMPTRMAAE